MEHVQIPETDFKVSRIALGTWAIGGWMWGGTDESNSIDTIHAAIDQGVDLIDTAPVYGFGRSEEIVGKAVKAYGGRDKLFLSTKAGLEWNKHGVFRNSEQRRIAEEVEASLRRLDTDYIDIYFIHWPDPKVPFEDTARVMEALRDEGKIRAVGVSNYSPREMDAFRAAGVLSICQPPYNLFEREIETDIIPFCHQNDIAIMSYGALCRGLLSGKMTRQREFKGDDLRKLDPKFQPPRFEQYLEAADRLEQLSDKRYGKALLPTAVRWVLDQGVDIAIWGGRKPEQMAPIEDVFGWRIDDDFKESVDAILSEAIHDPIGPEFMAPPAR